ncbi:MAG TPA: ATP-binding protein [Candidatus Woesearchaeota archaeon]|nr:ATP-binding protein [Candidatus Woesearchaeota archaeon]
MGESVGQLVGGSFEKVLLRVKKDSSIQLGEILVHETGSQKFFLQVYDLCYGSQISQQNLELMSGMELEQNLGVNLFDESIQVYSVAICKNLLVYDKLEKARLTAKSLPPLLSRFSRISEKDIEILNNPENPLFVGFLRSGSSKVKARVRIDAQKTFQHHVLLAATTGRGKSNLSSVIFWNLLENPGFGMLILDPHDEYYGRAGFGLKDHPGRNVIYFSDYDSPAGTRSLRINIKSLKPKHFLGVSEWSSAQAEAMARYYSRFRNRWIEFILLEKEQQEFPDVQPGTFSVIKRRLLNLLDVFVANGRITCEGIFSFDGFESTVSDICDFIEQGRKVIIDSSNISSQQEILVGSMVANLLFSRHKHYKKKGTLKQKPQAVIVLEEAPRVLGREVLKSGSNIFHTIAREGRKFKIGLYAVTQLPSLIPREILANMNTKILMGIEMKPERAAVIESSSNDLSTDERAIASLGTGEAIVSSSFLGFAVPVNVPLFSKKNMAGLPESNEKSLSFRKEDVELF